MTIEKAQKDICRYLFRENIIGTALPDGTVKAEGSFTSSTIASILRQYLTAGGWHMTPDSDFMRNPKTISFRKEGIEVFFNMRIFESEIKIRQWQS